MKRLFLLLIFFALCSSPASLARPGGGHSSASAHVSGSSSSHGYSYSGSGWGTHDNFHAGGANSEPHPMSSLLGLLIFIALVIVIMIIIRNQRQPAVAYGAKPSADYRKQRQQSLAAQISALKLQDCQFSTILFVDFVHSLYCKFYEYSTKPQFSYLSPFLSAELQAHFDSGKRWSISEIVVNGIRWLEIDATAADRDSILLEIDANYSLELQGQHSRYAVVERWQLSRRKGLLSMGPEKMQALSCPQCGAPAHFTDTGICNYCGAGVQKGDQQWCLVKRVVVSSQALVLEAGTASYAEERGTQAPTIKQADLIEQMQHWQQRYGYSDWEQFWQGFVVDIVQPYFTTIYRHWSDRQWQAARHLLSDRLYESNAFWQSLYAENDWFNRLDALRIEQVILAKIDCDQFYEAITVRIFASCLDYTVDQKGRLLGGSKTKPRRFSEYSTLVRRTGAERHDDSYSLSQCPQCGAPADNIGQSGECGYCGCKISTGQFSWVLFLIEQDEVYAS